jgi:toxin ParE1/3/4
MLIDSWIKSLKDRVAGAIDVLEQHPKIGRKVPEFDNELIRELIEGNYRIIYRIESNDQVGIARVHHAARLLKEL